MKACTHLLRSITDFGVFLLVFSATAASCSTQGIFAPIHITFDGTPVATHFKPTYVRYELTPEARLKWKLEESDEPLHLRLAPADPSAGDTLATTTSSKEESLFSLDYLKLIGSDVKEVFTAPAHWDRNDWVVLGGVSAGVGLAFAFDEDIRKAVQRHHSGVDNSFDAIEPFGAEYSWGVLAAFYVGGEVFGDAKARSVALDGLSASFIASGLIVQPLKFATGRSRPHEEQGAYDFKPFGAGINTSFPSGHATQAFAVASVIAEHYDSLWVKFTSYGLASAVGYARMNNDAHWASDVLAGAAIGTFVGHVVVKFNEQHRHFSFLPIIGPDMQGAELSWSF